MVDLGDKNHWPDLNEVVEAFESALARDGSAEIAAFEPAADHPDRLSILCELVRVDLEICWEHGRPRRLEDYLALFPQLAADAELVYAMAFEEYRLRLQAGEFPNPAEYAEKFGLEDRNWPSADRSLSAAPALSGHGSRWDDADSVELESGAEDLRFLFDSGSLTPGHSDLLRELDATDPVAAESLAKALAGFPRVGTRFLGFELCGELGRGAFGRVYLARQGDLANRLVALKVSSTLAGESHALAQLQHTNVVPIYSVHRRGALQAVCMPYLGGTTLADTLTVLKDRSRPPRSGLELLSTHVKSVDGARPRPWASPDTSVNEPNAEKTIPSERLTPSNPPVPPQVERLRKLSFVPAVLWLVERMAEGLAHAHERGILHRDLKPANILFADDGEPLLLDFNLSADMKIRFQANAALVGGTLPYMAPEQLQAFRDGRPLLDARSDVYAMGVILHELLTGSRPFPDRKGSVDDLFPEMIADRTRPIPDPRKANPSISPAVASIVRHVLDPEPESRYQTAAELQEDLSRQLENLPLKHASEPLGRERLAKWTKRHPRLTSSTTVGSIALALLIALTSGFLVRHRRFQALEASESFRRLVDERREAVTLLADPDADRELVLEGMKVCRGATNRYHVLDDPSWHSRPLVASLPADKQQRLREDMGDLLVRWARVRIRHAGPRDDARHRDATVDAATILDRASECLGGGQEKRTLLVARAELAASMGEKPEVIEKLSVRASASPRSTPLERIQAIIDQVDPGDRRALLAFLDEASRHDPLDYSNWMTLAVAYLRIGQFESARQCYGVAISLAPKLLGPYFNRGLLAIDTKDYTSAVEDFSQVLALRPDFATALVNRALAKLGMGDAPGAVEDLTGCLRREDAPPRAWFIRARAKMQMGDGEGAASDNQEGLKRQPFDEADFVARGLARLRGGDPQGALADFDAALGLDPRYIPALQDKASVLSESLGKVEESVKILDTLLKFHPSNVRGLAGRGVLLGRLGRRDAALLDAEKALKLEDSALNLYQVAGIYALTSKLAPGDVEQSLKLLSEAIRKDASWLAMVPKDSDLDPIRGLPAFLELIKALTVVGRAGATSGGMPAP